MAWYDFMSLIDSSDYKHALNTLFDRFVFTLEIIIKAPKYSCYYDLCKYDPIFQNETTNSAKIVRPRKRPKIRFGSIQFSVRLFLSFLQVHFGLVSRNITGNLLKFSVLDR